MSEKLKEGTIQPNGTDKIELGVPEVSTKKKTEKEMKDQQNESWTFDTAAMAKQELADAKNKKRRQRGKVANLLRKLGMKEGVESINGSSKQLEEKMKQEAEIQEGIIKGTIEVAKQAVRVPYRAVKRAAGAVLDTVKDVGDAASSVKKKFKEDTQAPQSFKQFRSTLSEAKPAKAVNIDKVHAAGDKPHEEKWEDAKKVKKESFTADELLQALKEGLWPGTPEYKAKFEDKYKQEQGGGAGVKRGSRYGSAAQKPEPEEHDADDKPAKKNK